MLRLHVCARSMFEPCTPRCHAVLVQCCPQGFMIFYSRIHSLRLRRQQQEPALARSAAVVSGPWLVPPMQNEIAKLRVCYSRCQCQLVLAINDFDHKHTKPHDAKHFYFASRREAEPASCLDFRIKNGNPLYHQRRRQ